jgi:hypothetical protein
MQYITKLAMSQAQKPRSALFRDKFDSQLFSLFPNLILMLLTRVSSKQTKINFGSNRNKISFAFVSVCFVKPKNKNFGLFRCFEPISKQPKQTELFRNKPKQTETTLNFVETYSCDCLKICGLSSLYRERTQKG